jgi:L-serine dehydratase
MEDIVKSLRELYRIGHGPSSSHTMGPQKACAMFRESFPDAIAFQVTLYGSLSLTGKGHLTDAIIRQTLPNVEVIFSDQFLFDHPNTMDILGTTEAGETCFWRVYSIGGGAIQIEGEESRQSKEVYPHHSFEEIKRYCNAENIRLYEYVERFEGLEIWTYLEYIYDAMMSAVDRGLATTGVLPGELRVKRKANDLKSKIMPNEPIEITESRIVSSYAYAVAEENASGGIVVTAPTCGSCGIVPAVLRYMRERHKFTKKRCLRALATGGLIGNVIKHNATISGAIAGCQAEVGSATAMAAAMHADLFKLSIEQIEYAAEISLEHHLGLTCDPILGYVQIPCIERNAVGALRAIDACGLAFFLSESRQISLDMVIETMYQTGKDIHTKYRETGTGGLALLYQRLRANREEDR